jgi:hypothetical protein
MIRRTAVLATMVLLLIASLATPAVASPGEESGFVSLINQERASNGLNSLEVYWDLVDDARIHAGVMNEADEIFHSSNLAAVTTGWAALGENVGVGPAVGDLHTAFMNSPGHRANILGDWDKVGVGVTHSDKGYMFVTVMFMKSAEAAPEPEPAPVTEPAPAPVTAPAPAPASSPIKAVAAVASAPAASAPPVADPEPVPEPVKRLIEELLEGVPFPFSLA